MRDRFVGEEVWERVGLPDEASAWVEQSDLMAQFRSYLFTRIVPILKDIGLWGPRIQGAFTDMGVIQFAEADLDAEMANDEAAAEELDAQMAASMAHVAAVAGGDS
jgi:hypothetical protein